MVIPGYTRLYLVMLGYTWLSLVIPGFTFYLDMGGYGWLYMVNSPGLPMDMRAWASTYCGIKDW